MPLTGPQIKVLHSALVSAFPDYSGLAQMVGEELEENLNVIVDPGALNKVVFALITWAEAHGRIEDLVVGARNQNSGNPELAQVQILLQGELPSFAAAALVPVPVQLGTESRYFYGREAPLHELLGLLGSEGAAYVYGAPGVGKTFFLRETARNLYDQNHTQFPDGVVWSDLTVTPSFEHAVQQLLDAYGYRQTDTNSLALLQELLSRKRALWVIDGADRVATASGLKDVVNGHGGCTILIAGRHSELVEVARRELPVLALDDALRLFQSLSGRTINGEEASARDICEQLGYLPLAISIFAGWAASRAQRQKSLTVLAEQLRQSPILDVLTPDTPAALAANRNVRASFEVSWLDLDSDPLRQAFKSIAVFAGEDWDATAMAYVLDVHMPAAQRLIDELLNRCLLDFGRAEGRYSASPLLRAYGKEKLEADSPLFWRAAEYYCALIVDRYPALQGEEVVSATQQIMSEIGNLRGVWRYCRNHHSSQATILIRELLVHIWEFLYIHGLTQDMADLFSCANEAMESNLTPEMSAEIIYGNALIALGQGNAESVVTQLQQAADTFKAQNIHRRTCNVWLDIAQILIGTGDLKQAQRYVSSARKLAQSHDLYCELGKAYWNLGIIQYERGLLAEALEQLNTALPLLKQAGDIIGTCGVQRDIGRVYIARGEVERSFELLQSAVELLTRVQNFQRLGFTYCELGTAHIQAGDLTKAESSFVSGKEIAEKIGNDWIKGSALSGIAEVRLRQGNLDNARGCFEQAWALAKKVGAPQKEAFIFYGISDILLQQRSYDLVSTYLSHINELANEDIRDEVLYAIARLITTKYHDSASDIIECLTRLTTDMRQLTILLVNLARLVANDQPEMVHHIGGVLKEINEELPKLRLTKGTMNSLQPQSIKTVGELLCALLQDTVRLSARERLQVERRLRASGYWPKDVKSEEIAPFTRRGSWSGGGGCFPKGTQVALSTGSIAIEQLRVGHQILAMDIEHGDITIGQVQLVYYGYADSYLIVNDSLRITETHLVYTAGGWIPAGGLCVGDVIYDANRVGHSIRTIRTILDRIAVYNIELAAIHTFYAEEILVHNMPSKHSRSQ